MGCSHFLVMFSSGPLHCQDCWKVMKSQGEYQWQLIVKRGDGLQLYFLPLCVHSQGYDCHSSSCHVLLLGLAGTTDTDICLVTTILHGVFCGVCSFCSHCSHIASGAIHFCKEHALDQKIAVDSIHLCSVRVPPFFLSQICSALSQKTR